MKNLVAAILIQTVRDWAKVANRPEILRFMESEQFALYAEIVNIDAGKMRNMVAANSFTKRSLRAPYHKEVQHG